MTDSNIGKTVNWFFLIKQLAAFGCYGYNFKVLKSSFLINKIFEIFHPSVRLFVVDAHVYMNEKFYPYN